MPTKKRGSGNFDNREQGKRTNENPHSHSISRQHADPEIKPYCRPHTSVSFSFPEDELYELYTNHPTLYQLIHSVSVLLSEHNELTSLLSCEHNSSVLCPPLAFFLFGLNRLPSTLFFIPVL